MAIAAGLVGYFADKNFNESYFKSFVSLFVATIVIFLIGIGYLGSIIGYEKAFAVGLYPFILSELFKIGLAVSIIPSIYKYLKI